MTEQGFDQEVPVRRGRRDPELAIQLGLEGGGIAPPDEDMDDETEEDALNIGDPITIRVNIDELIDGRSNRFGFEASTTIRPDETEEEANDRLRWVALVRVQQIADERTEYVASRNAERLRRPIRPRQR